MSNELSGSAPVEVFSAALHGLVTGFSSCGREQVVPRMGGYTDPSVRLGRRT
jgi:hypothetical protein